MPVPNHYHKSLLRFQRVETMEQQSAVIAYRRQKQEMKIVLVTSLETFRWVLPKGNIETGLSPRESAAREAYEEAGVEGEVARRSVGTYEYVKTELKGGGAAG